MPPSPSPGAGSTAMPYGPRPTARRASQQTVEHAVRRRLWVCTSTATSGISVGRAPGRHAYGRLLSLSRGNPGALAASPAGERPRRLTLTPPPSGPRPTLSPQERVRRTILTPPTSGTTAMTDLPAYTKRRWHATDPGSLITRPLPQALPRARYASMPGTADAVWIEGWSASPSLPATDTGRISLGDVDDWTIPDHCHAGYDRRELRLQTDVVGRGTVRS